MRFYHRSICLLLILGLFVPLAGCKQNRRERETAEAAPTSSPGPGPRVAIDNKKPATEADPNAGLSGLARVWTEQEIKNNLSQIGLAYHNYADSSGGRGPAKAADLAPFYEKNQKITEALEKNWITFYYNVRMNQLLAKGSSNTILAYETDPDRLGQRWVLMGDRSVQKVTQEEFDKMPRAGK